MDKKYSDFWKQLGEKEENFNEHSKDLIQRMLEYDPEARILKGDIITHPWLTSDSILTSDEAKDKIVNKKKEIS